MKSFDLAVPVLLLLLKPYVKSPFGYSWSELVNDQPQHLKWFSTSVMPSSIVPREHLPYHPFWEQDPLRWVQILSVADSNLRSGCFWGGGRPPHRFSILKRKRKMGNFKDFQAWNAATRLSLGWRRKNIVQNRLEPAFSLLLPQYHKPSAGSPPACASSGSMKLAYFTVGLKYH